MAIDNKTLEEQKKLLDMLSGAYEDEAKKVQQLLAAQQQLNDARAVGADNVQELQIKVADLNSKLEQEGKQIRDLTASVKKNSEAQAELGESMSKLKDVALSTGVAFNSVVEAMDTVAGTSIANLGKGVGSAASQLAGFVRDINNLEVGLRRSTGFQDRYSKSFQRLRDDYRKMGIPQEILAKNLESLNANFLAFDGLSKSQRDNITNLTGEFFKMGASSETTSKALDMLKSGIGNSASEAVRSMRGFQEFRKEVGMSLDNVLQNFTALTPQIAKFGSEAPRVFKDLQMRARSLQMDVKEIFNVADQFDTFQGAMEIVGKLNSQFGMQLNTVQLMRAEEKERVEILRSQFFVGGRTFDALEKRQKQMIASIVTGGDVEQARRLFQQGMDITAFQADVGRDDRAGTTAGASVAERALAGTEAVQDAALNTLGGYDKALEKMIGVIDTMQNNANSIANTLLLKSAATTTTNVGTSLITTGAGAYGGYKILQKMGVRGAVEAMAKGGGKAGALGKLLKFAGIGGAAVAPEVLKQTAKTTATGVVRNTATPAFTRAVQATTQEAMKKAAPGLVGKIGGSVVRGLPFLGLALSVMDATKRYAAGDTKGALIDLAGGAMSMIPGGGFLRAGLSIGGAVTATGVNALRDASGGGMSATAQGAAPGVPLGVQAQPGTTQAANQGMGSFVADEVVLPIQLNIDGNKFIEATATANKVIFNPLSR